MRIYRLEISPKGEADFSKTVELPETPAVNSLIRISADEYFIHAVVYHADYDMITLKCTMTEKMHPVYTPNF